MTRVAAADIGATNARFRVTDDGEMVSQVTYPTADHTDGAALLREALGDAGVKACCIAVAGPVMAGSARTTNSGLVFDLAGIRSALEILSGKEVISRVSLTVR